MSLALVNSDCGKIWSSLYLLSFQSFRLLQPQHQVHALHGGAGAAFSQVIKQADQLQLGAVRVGQAEDLQRVLACKLVGGQKASVRSFAERMHQLARKEFWGYQVDEELDNEALIAEKYVGIRPAPGYPACPEHSEKRLLFNLLQAEKHSGVELTENFAMTPPAAVSGFYFAHPDAQYFNVGRIGKDQVMDYSQRTGHELADMERLLSTQLNYK